MYCHLHTHSCYSFLEGLPAPAALARAAAEDGMPALALTDHNGLSGSIAFYRACQELGVKPILGLEVDLPLPYRLSPAPAHASPGSHDTGVLVLLAMDRAGWNNLCRISSALLNQPEEAPRSCTTMLLSQFSAGLICLTGGCRGALLRLLVHPGGADEGIKLLDELAEIFPERLYVELCAPSEDGSTQEAALARLAEQQRLPAVAAHNIFYLEETQAAVQCTLSAMRVIKPLARLRPEDCAPPGAHFLTTRQMQQRFTRQPGALEMAGEIADRCRLDLGLDKAHYPHLSLPEGMRAIDVLRRKAEDGARRLYGSPSPDVSARLEMELQVIAARGYEPIFLIAEEMLSFARQHDIPSASRGSASSSLVAHCTGITTPDPLALDLFFERFLNPARATPPDIDTDFCSRRRDEVIQHLFAVYGQEQVSMVGTVNTFRPRSALSEVAKAHGLKPQEIRGLTGGLHRFWHPRMDAAQANGGGPYSELIAKYGDNPRYADLFQQASALLGLPHHLSVHPGGVVIAPGPIVDFVPVARSGGKGVTITQFELDDVEKVGLVKLDLLGIRGLTVLGDVAVSIRSWRRKEFRSDLQVLDTVPEVDAETSQLVSSGRTIGCFQIESPGMRATLKEIQADCPADIMAALALYRPGPLKGGLRDAFVRRHNRQEAVQHIHPALSVLLRETYGVILYQEQVLRIAHELAGFSLAEADLLRRAMSHFDPGKQMQVLKQKFVAGAQERSSVPPETGEQVWEMMAAFSGYGFPKAHAASYAQIAWRSAWCKAHYPAEFIAAVLANWGGYYPQTTYLSEARRMGLAVRPPHINSSRQQFSVAYPRGEPVLYMGLDQLSDLTRRTQERIIRYRPFHSLSDFLIKADPRVQEAENLVQVGALEGLGTIPDLLRELTGRRPVPGQLSLFEMNESSGEDWSLEQKTAAQQRLLGASLSAHPLELCAGKIRAANAITTLEAAARIGKPVRVAGVRLTVMRSLTARGASMAFLTLEDLEGMLDVILFPDVYRRARGLLSAAPTPILVEGTMERDANTGEPVLQAERLWKID